VVRQFAPITDLVDDRQIQSRPSWGSRLWRALSAPQLRSGVRWPASATLDVQAWISAAPWQPNAGWAALASLLAAGALWQWQSFDLPHLILLWLLVDPLWGAIWRLAGGRQHVLRLYGGEAGRVPRLPYLQAGSPAAQMLAFDESNALPYLFRIGAPTLLLAGITALALGSGALLLTLLVALASALGWVWRRTWKQPPAALHAVVTILLPWSLALWVANHNIAVEQSRAIVVLAVLWTVHHWGATRSSLFVDDRVAHVLLAVAQIGIVLLLITVQAPFLLPVLAVLWLPTWLNVYRRHSLDGLGIWWLASLLISALAIGQ
jgi:hypothetical protein